MRIARIARPGALYGASDAARTFEGVNRSLENQSVSDEVVGTNVNSEKENLKFGHVKVFLNI